ncbi:SigE family RNA polymerase sigma factor [Streptomyces sp. NPDC008139]|uniref:SigE family RNA polymerase sigma factor n=1 Tax=Streptomyces sp. NPDC008139 TaxID=3364814 RepID=UPI0036E4DE4D
MNTLHITTDTAVHATHTHSAHSTGTCAVRTTEKSGAANGRGYVRGAVRGTSYPTSARHRPPFIAAVDSGAEHQAKPVQSATTADQPSGTFDGAAARTPAQAEAEAAFTAYVQERRASLYATAYHLTGDRFAAEDLLQSALFSTYRAWDRISDKAAVGGYLRRTMTNLHISAWRRRKLSEYPTEELPETVGDTDEMGGTELRAVLWQALARLPEQQRTMLVLRYYEGRTDPEIADILGISVGTVKSSIWRSLRRMRDDEALSFGRDEEDAFGELVA